MRPQSLVFIGILLLSGIPAAAQPNLLVPLGGDFGDPIRLVEAPPDTIRNHLSWPKAVVTPDGTILVAFVKSRSHHTLGVPAVSRSLDRGKTFSAPMVVQEFGPELTPDYAHAANIALGLANNGDVLMMAMVYTPQKDSRIFGWRSSDEGLGWRSIDTETLDASTGSVYGHIFSVNEGLLAVAGHYRPGANNNVRRLGGIWLSHSRDDGKTWKHPVTISQSEDALFEPAIIHAWGAYRGLARYDPGNHYRELFSQDGDLWNESVSTILGGERLPSPFLVEDRYAQGVLWSLHTARNPVGTDGKTFLWRRNINLNEEWEKVGHVITYPKGPETRTREDFGYPWMVQLGEHEWFLIFYYGRFVGKNDLWGMRLNLKVDKLPAANSAVRPRD